jgi:hypothetical protein
VVRACRLKNDGKFKPGHRPMAEGGARRRRHVQRATASPPPGRGRQFGAAMPDRRDILTCSCEDTMPLDTQALRHGCRGARLVTGHQFCRHEFQRARELVATGAPITMGCTQEAPLFRDIAAESGGDVTFVNLRGNAGWSADAASAGPKMAALAAAAAEPMPDVPFVNLKRKGVILVYSRDERAIEAANCAFRRCWRIVEGVPRLVAESEEVRYAQLYPCLHCRCGHCHGKRRRSQRLSGVRCGGILHGSGAPLKPRLTEPPDHETGGWWDG